MTSDPQRGAYEAVAEVPRSDIRDAFAAVLQARLSWPQADALASDLIGYLHRQGLVVFREYHPQEVADLRVSLAALADRWENHTERPGAFYPEASAWADGVEAGYSRAADEIRELVASDDYLAPGDQT